MSPIYFKYKTTSNKYIYVEECHEYCMPLLLMLKFKKYFREVGYYNDYPLKSWLNTLSKEELKDIAINAISSTSNSTQS
jgi:hypothetical protein